MDTDGNGVGNNADPDDDGDGVVDGGDALPLDPTVAVDTDRDGVRPSLFVAIRPDTGHIGGLALSASTPTELPRVRA